MNSRWIGTIAACLLYSAAAQGGQKVQGSIFNPAEFSTQAASLEVSSGTIAIDTKDGTNAPTMTVGATVYTGEIVTNENNVVSLALFNFGSVNISSTAVVTVQGNLGLVLASQGDMTLARDIALNGGNATVQNTTGAGGPGGEGGVRNSSTNSLPPSVTGGNGGMGSNEATRQGVGFGGGHGGSSIHGGGAGYGGAGGKSAFNNAQIGSTYGDAGLTNLLGGSGGGGCDQRGGGGGGGALALIAVKSLSISGVMSANGGNGYTSGASGVGGGGSGGAILLAADKIVMSGTLSGKGGKGGERSTVNAGGGGGGGRIAVYANTREGFAEGSVLVTGGTRGEGPSPNTATNGSDGSVRNSDAFPFAKATSGMVIMFK